MIDYYKCQYHFNASHSFDGNKEQAHSHTFTLILYIRNHSGRDMDFKQLDRMIEIFLGRYENLYLNELPCFAGNASIEAIGDYFYEQLKIKLSELNAELMQLDIGDTPLGVYQVCDRILLPTVNERRSRENLETILFYKKQMPDQKK